MLALLLPLLGPVLERLGNLIPDPTARAKAIADAQAQMVDALSKSDAAQMEVNRAEASNPSLFVAGWRPAIGWVCASALGFQYLVRPVAPWLANLCGAHVPELPGLDDSLWQLMFGMLGLGAFRSYEKVQGVASGVAVPTQGARR